MKTLVPNSQKIPTTLQGFFDIAWKWMHREGAKLCKNSKNLCYNRNEFNTNACIIGAAIPDSEIPLTSQRVKFDAKFLLKDLKSFSDYFIEEEVIPTISLLQSCHDDAEDVEDCIERLRKLAEHFNLTIPNLES